MKKLLLILIAIIISVFAFKCILGKEYKVVKNDAIIDQTSITERLLTHSQLAKKLIDKNKNYNSEVVFLIDMKQTSNKNRFFVYSLKENKIIDKGLVAHGVGSETHKLGALKFSNIENSYSTSLGTYAISNSYNCKFGKAYKLIGLNSTNSNAFVRNIVLHKYKSVPYDETNNPICLSNGCPMVNEKFFNRLEKIIDHSKKTILMTIYY